MFFWTIILICLFYVKQKFQGFFWRGEYKIKPNFNTFTINVNYEDNTQTATNRTTFNLMYFIDVKIHSEVVVFFFMRAKNKSRQDHQRARDVATIIRINVLPFWTLNNNKNSRKNNRTIYVDFFVFIRYYYTNSSGFLNYVFILFYVHFTHFLLLLLLVSYLFVFCCHRPTCVTYIYFMAPNVFQCSHHTSPKINPFLVTIWHEFFPLSLYPDCLLSFSLHISIIPMPDLQRKMNSNNKCGGKRGLVNNDEKVTKITE